MTTARELEVLSRVYSTRNGIWQASRELKSLARKMGRKGLLKSAGPGAGGVALYRLTPTGFCELENGMAAQAIAGIDPLPQPPHREG